MLPKIKRSSVTGQSLPISFLPTSMTFPVHRTAHGRRIRQIQGTLEGRRGDLEHRLGILGCSLNCRNLRIRAPCRGTTQLSLTTFQQA